MAPTHKLEVQHEAKSSGDKLFGMLSYNASQLPEYFPQLIQSVQIIGNGHVDGIDLGTIIVWNFDQEGTSVILKDRITAVDNKNRSITYTLIEGDLLNTYKNFETRLDICPNGDGSSYLVKWSAEYEKENEDVPDPTAFMKLLEMLTKELDVQFLKQQA